MWGRNIDAPGEFCTLHPETWKFASLAVNVFMGDTSKITGHTRNESANESRERSKNKKTRVRKITVGANPQDFKQCRESRGVLSLALHKNS